VRDNPVSTKPQTTGGGVSSATTATTASVASRRRRGHDVQSAAVPGAVLGLQWLPPAWVAAQSSGAGRLGIVRVRVKIMGLIIIRTG
jgi:hypothetical protein